MPAAAITPFAGFPAEGMRFLDELAMNNAKPFWDAHRTTYEAACRGPMLALLAALEPEFGPGKLFRPYRDVRFSADKSPYQTHVAALVGSGRYVHLSADGLYVGGGRHHMDTASLAAYRAAVASDIAGPEFASIVAKVRRAGYDVDGEALRTAPRGYPADHPRIDLLRMKEVHGGRFLPAGADIQRPAVLKTVQKTFRDLGPFLDWLDAHVPSTMH